MTIIQKGEPMSDLISRQAAIDALDAVCVKYDISPHFDDKRTDAEKSADWWDMFKVLSMSVIDGLPPAQPEEAIPVSWIESRIERIMTMDNAFGGLTANIMLVMLNEWKREQEGETT